MVKHEKVGDCKNAHINCSKVKSNKIHFQPGVVADERVSIIKRRVISSHKLELSLFTQIKWSSEAKGGKRVLLLQQGDI